MGEWGGTLYFSLARFKIVMDIILGVAWTKLLYACCLLARRERRRDPPADSGGPQVDQIATALLHMVHVPALPLGFANTFEW